MIEPIENPRSPESPQDAFSESTSTKVTTPTVETSADAVSVSAVRKNGAGGRARRAVESFRCASEAIGPVDFGMGVFAVTRGQWSMIDAILHCLDQVGRSSVSVWTWTVAEHDIQVLTRLMVDGRLIGGRLVIDGASRVKYRDLLMAWKATFGPESVRYVTNHSKISLIQSEAGHRLCLRGSMNLNYNPRFEQFDMTEGGPEFELVRAIEESLPILEDDCAGSEIYEASKLTAKPGQIFTGKLKVWEK